MKDSPVRGQTSNIGFVFIPDSSSTTGAGKTGLTNASAGLNVSVRREKSSTVTAYTGANIGAITTLGTWANPGSGKVNIKEIDPTNMQGLYELHFEDAIFNTSDTSRKLLGMVTVTGGAPSPFELPLLAVDSQDGVRMAMTSLPNAAAGANTGLPVVGTQVPNATAGANGGLPTNDSDLCVKSKLQGFLTTLITEGATGRIAAAFQLGWNVASSTWTAADVNQSGDAYNLVNTRLTAARAGYLDNLNVGGAVASHADILAINQSASKHLLDRKSTRLNSSHYSRSRMPSSA